MTTIEEDKNWRCKRSKGRPKKKGEREGEAKRASEKEKREK